MKTERKTKKIRVLNPDTNGIPVALLDCGDSDVTVIADQAQIEALIRACAQ